MRSVSKVGILIVRDVPRLAILIVRRTFDHFHLLPGGDFDQLFCPRGEKFNFFFNENVKIPTPCSTSPPPPPPHLPSSALTLIGALHLGNRHDVFQVYEKSPG